MIEPTSQIKSYILKKPGGYVNKESEHCYNKAIDCSMGENSKGLPNLPRKLKKLNLSKLISIYPDPTYSSLRKKLAEEHCLDINNISIGTGANEILERIARTYLGKSDKCIVLNPIFYRIIDASLRCTKNIVHINLDYKENYGITKRIVNKIQKTKNVKLIWICNPNNPTGTVTNLERIEEIAKAKTDTLICVDEAYGEYIDDWNNTKSSTNLIGTCKNILVIRSFSKLYSLAGLTCGYVIGNEELIFPLNCMRLEFPISGLAEELAIHALDNKKNFLKHTGVIAEERGKLQKVLAKLENIEYMPSETNIILIKHKKLNIYQKLLENHIITADMNNCKGIEGEHYVRTTIQPESKINDILMKTIVKLNKQI